MFKKYRIYKLGKFILDNLEHIPDIDIENTKGERLTKRINIHTTDINKKLHSIDFIEGSKWYEFYKLD